MRTENNEQTFGKPASYYLNENDYKRTTTTPRVDVDVKKLSEELSLNYAASKLPLNFAMVHGIRPSCRTHWALQNFIS